MKESITFITGNLGKVESASKYLHSSIVHKKLDLIEIQSLNLEEIVTYKAEEAYRQIQAPILIEDVSLTFSALGKLPGPLIKWFYEELGNDGICELLNGYKDRSAIARVMYGLHDGRKVMVFDGAIPGMIADAPRGGDFGWQPIFIPDGYNQTLGEMDEEGKDATSMRKIALAKLNRYLIRS